MSRSLPTDGIDHINTITAGNTELGRMLTNLARTPFVHPEHGAFQSVEGYWYWLGAGANSDNDHMRGLAWHTAKATGRELEVIPMDVESFRDQIRLAIRAKILQNEKLRQMFVESTLPFRHYFCYGAMAKNQKVIEPARHRWQMDYLEELRRELQA